MTENGTAESRYADDQRVVAPLPTIVGLKEGHIGVQIQHASGWNFAASVPPENLVEFARGIQHDHQHGVGAFSSDLGEFMERLASFTVALLTPIQGPSNNLIYAIGSSENGDRQITVFNGNTLNLSAAMAAELARQLVEPPAAIPEDAVIDEISFPEAGQVEPSQRVSDPVG